MNIQEIFKNQNPKHVVGDLSDIDIEKLAFNSNENLKGSLFFCFKGENFDGHNFADIAMEKGARALVVERPLFVDLPQIVVKDSRKAMALCAAQFFGNPQKNLKIVGVTGTNGKTTTTHILKSIFESAGFKAGVIGTIGIFVGNEKLPAKLTTPDPIEFYEILKQMKDNGVSHVAMEVSAHALALNKLCGTRFDVGVLTNITQDHLDFFKTFENYKQTKQQFLNSKFCDAIAVNVDDESGKEIFLNQEKNLKMLSFGIENPSDVFAVREDFSLNGTTCFLNLFDEVLKVQTKLCGKFNLYNMLAAATAAKLLGIDNKFVIEGLQKMQSVEGRFNVIDLGDDKKAILDYAHTPDGLQNILSSVRALTDGKVVSVFGCGGNRDTKKRPIMGRISDNLADFSIITSDNSRFEKPMDIICDIEQGMVSKNYLCIADRKTAIAVGLKKLNKGDVLVVSGKGAENYLDIMGVKYPYSDQQTILEENQKLNKERKFC